MDDGGEFACCSCMFLLSELRGAKRKLALCTSQVSATSSPFLSNCHLETFEIPEWSVLRCGRIQF